MKKKMIGFIFAATMLFGVSITASAETVTGNDASGNDVKQVSGNDVLGSDGKIEMGAEVSTAHLEIKITSGTKVIANPYGLVDSTLGLTGTETLKGSTITFENKSNTAIAVGLTGQIVLPDYSKTTPAVATADKVTVATSDTSLKTAKTKQVFIQAAITNAGGGKLQTTTTTPTAEKALVYSATGAKLSNTPVLKATGDTTADASDTMVLTITGGTSKSPTSEWTDADKFTVVTKYDIQFGDSAKLSKFK